MVFLLRGDTCSRHECVPDTLSKDETVYKVCDATGEDVTCSNQFLFEYDIKDHSTYLGVPM